MAAVEVNNAHAGGGTKRRRPSVMPHLQVLHPLDALGPWVNHVHQDDLHNHTKHAEEAHNRVVVNPGEV